jgi:hypothetical protein
LSVEGYLWIDSGIPLKQIYIYRGIHDRKMAEYLEVGWLLVLSLDFDKRVHTAIEQRSCVSLSKADATFIIVSQVKNDLIKVLQGESIKYFSLTLRVIRYMTNLSDGYVTNFFMDSIRSFFSSLDPCIQIIIRKK